MFNSKYLYEIYTKVESEYTGRVTVPILWDKQTHTIVNNESSEIIRIDFVIRIWYAAKRYHLTIPYPIQTEYQMNVAEMPKANPMQQVTEVMRSLPNFGNVAAERFIEEENASNIRYYAQGEWVFPGFLTN